MLYGIHADFYHKKNVEMEDRTRLEGIERRIRRIRLVFLWTYGPHGAWGPRS